MSDVTGWNTRLPSLSVTLVALLATTLPASAATVYQYTNSAGETVFTDEPVAGAKVHEIESAPVIPMEPVELPEAVQDDLPNQAVPNAPDNGADGNGASSAGAPTSEPAAEPSLQPASYERLAIIEPVDGEVASRPHGSITIELAIEPALQRDDRIFILVDGQARVQDSTGRRHLVNGLASGRHELIAQIRRNGTVLRESAPVGFQLITPAQ